MQYLFLILIFVFLLPNTAMAYIDPAVGSLLLQGAAATLLTLGVFWRKVISYLKGVLRKGGSSDD